MRKIFDTTSTLVAVHEVMPPQFIASYKKPPRKLILDFNATDDRVHGIQEGRFFHGYYDLKLNTCFGQMSLT